MIQLRTETESGTECPKCKNLSVFNRHVRTNLLKIYRYSYEKCYYQGCDHFLMYDKEMYNYCC
jgi:hypothetical protein